MGFFPPDYKPASGESSGSKSELNPKYWSSPVSTWVTAKLFPSVPAASSYGHVVTGYQYHHGRSYTVR